MAIYRPFRLVRESDTEVEYIYASGDEELVRSPRSVIASKRGLDDTALLDLRSSDPKDGSAAAGVVWNAMKGFRANGSWPRGGAVCS